jgi:hypothetical protein
MAGEAVEFVDQVVAADRAGDQSAQAFAGVLVDDGGIFTGRRSMVESNWKSTAHTLF